MVWSKTSVHCNLGNTDKAKVWVIYAAERSSSHTSAHYNSTLTVWPQWADLQCVTLWLLGRGKKRRFPGHAPDSRCFGQPWRLMALSLWRLLFDLLVVALMTSDDPQHEDPHRQSRQCFCFMAQIANAHLTLYYRHLMHVYDHAVYASLCPGYFDLNSDSRHDNATVTRGEMGVWDHTRITAINSKFAVLFVFGIVALKIGTRFNCSTAENNGSVICFVRLD